MAMIDCPECNKQLSDLAKSCPHCGAPAIKKKAVKKPTSPIVVFAMALMAIGIVINIALNNHDAASGSGELTQEQQKKKTEHEELLSAATACMMMVEKSLNDPSSADFPRASEAAVKDEGNGRFHVQFKGRAKNAFGALVLQVFDCELNKADGNWSAISIDTIK